MTAKELRSLIDDALEGTISEADFLRLEAKLSVDPVARREYYDRVFLSTLLEAEASTQPEQARDLDCVTSDLPSRRWRLAFAAMAAVCASLLLVIAWLWQGQIAPNGPTLAHGTTPNDPGTISTDKERQSSGFAILSGQADAVWGDKVLSTGGIVPPGEVRLESGLAQFELFSGVTLVVEGEARFSILSPMEVSVASGKVRARVPEPARTLLA